MALIQCPECAKSVSTSATACPNCGAPIAVANEAKAAGAVLVTTQATSKKFKAQQLLSALMIIVGFVWLMTLGSQTSPSGAQGVIPVLLLLSGLIWFLVARVRAWWHHG
jgi:hypothetical protein